MATSAFTTLGLDTYDSSAPAGRRRRSWQVPKWDGSLRPDVAEWSKQQVHDGIEYQESSPGFSQLQESIRVLSGEPTDSALGDKQKDGRYSKVRTNRLKRNLREMVNALSDIRYAPGYHSDASEWQGAAALLNKVGASWYNFTFADLKIKKAIQFMAISQCGWAEVCYRRMPGERNRADIDIIAHSSLDVVMTGMPDSGDYQEAYTVSIIRDLPMYQAHALWPSAQDKLVPTAETPKGWRDKVRKVWTDVFGGEADRQTAKNPTTRLYYQFVLDFSVNRGKEMKTMGRMRDSSGTMRDTEWSYNVPYVGQQLPATFAPDGSVATWRTAREEECRFFPGRRAIVTAECMSAPLYDDAYWDWHGKVPLVPFRADSWPFGEFSMIHDQIPMHETINEIERITHQTIRNRFDPSLLYNTRALTRDKAKSIRADVQGQRIGYNGAEGSKDQIVSTLLPKDFNIVEGYVTDFVKSLTEEMDYEMGVRDVSALAKLKVGASSESMEKLMELAGPIVKGISRELERSMRDLAEMFKWLVYQYYTTPKIMQIVGVDGLTPANFDFQPGNLVPSHMPGEDKSRPSQRSAMERAQWAADAVHFLITPNTLHEVTQTSQKLVYLQLARAGLVPIDPWTLAEIFRVGNFGKVPDGASTILERYFAWEDMKAEHQAAIAAKMQEAMGEAAPQGGGGGGAGGTGAPGLGPNGGNKGTGGRAPSGQAAPRSATKGDGRQYIRESR